MADQENPKSLDSEVRGESSKSGSSYSKGANTYHYKNPPDATIPDSATLRDQWRFAGSNPLRSRHNEDEGPSRQPNQDSYL
ncbi:hypothetical protein C5167_008962 [Papaver somniferum]|uniref:Uncharacterized protein n=1 Tax=Papaver somniferum TaxID=3469 RepID=A0A4Y7JYY6_PAPSO|nr:hypothetical protein C5167_008962 [Papaver somniferum]